MSESQLQSCTMCSYCTTNPRQLLNHVFTIHRHDPNFHVYCSHCMRSYKKLSAYRKHISRGCTVPVVEDITTEQRSLCPSSSEIPEGDTYNTLINGDPGVENPTNMNRLSILNEVPLFDLCVCIPHDIMHVLLEGVLPRHCKMLLRYYIVDQRLFTVKYLNQQIKAFKYGYSEKAGAPRQIDGERLILNLCSQVSVIMYNTCVIRV